tara:strand:+ start:208 stop:474 length:267 start_codon:yes stop_codon:yes gene_type:complete
MKKYYINILILILLSGCAAPGSALLGPAVTGATTKSLAQASLSFGTNQIVRKIHETSKKSKNQVQKIVKKIDNFKFKPKKVDLSYFHR